LIHPLSLSHLSIRALSTVNLPGQRFDDVWMSDHHGPVVVSTGRNVLARMRGRGSASLKKGCVTD